VNVPVLLVVPAYRIGELRKRMLQGPGEHLFQSM
jgi:hypothetical protein